MAAQATVSSKGQVTLPIAMRTQLGISAGSQIQFEVRGKELVITPELPIRAYRGILFFNDTATTEIDKEADRNFE